MHSDTVKYSKDTPLQTHFCHQHLRNRGNAAVSTIFIYKIWNSDKLAHEWFCSSPGGQRHVIKGGTMPCMEDGSDWLVFREVRHHVWHFFITSIQIQNYHLQLIFFKKYSLCKNQLLFVHQKPLFQLTEVIFIFLKSKHNMSI